MPVSLDHSDFPAPPVDTVIWRYSSLAKLLALLVSKELYMTSIKVLRDDDPFEGSATGADYKLAGLLRSDTGFAESFFANNLVGWPVDFRPKFLESITSDVRLHTDMCFVNCWHANSHESAALWSLYSGQAEGVAIRSSVKRLAESVQTDRDLILGRVEYRDYENEHSQLGQVLRPAFAKRESFAHEKELRLLFWSSGEWSRPADQRFEWANGTYPLWDGGSLEDLPPGVSFPCNPVDLIDEILVSPYAQPWVFQTIASVVTGLGLQIPVRHSALMRGPAE